MGGSSGGTFTDSGGTFTDIYGSTYSGGSPSDLGGSTLFSGGGGGGGGGGSFLSSLFGGGGGGGGSGSGGGSNQQLLNTVLTQLLGQQRMGFGGSFVGGPSIASGRAQAPAFGPPALEGGGGRASSPLERLALAMAALR